VVWLALLVSLLLHQCIVVSQISRWYVISQQLFVHAVLFSIPLLVSDPIFTDTIAICCSAYIMMTVQSQLKYGALFVVMS